MATLLRTNLVTNPRPAGSTAGWAVSSGESITFVANDGGEPCIEALDAAGGGGACTSRLPPPRRARTPRRRSVGRFRVGRQGARHEHCGQHARGDRRVRRWRDGRLRRPALRRYACDDHGGVHADRSRRAGRDAQRRRIPPPVRLACPRRVPEQRVQVPQGRHRGCRHRGRGTRGGAGGVLRRLDPGHRHAAVRLDRRGERLHLDGDLPTARADGDVGPGTLPRRAGGGRVELVAFGRHAGADHPQGGGTSSPSGAGAWRTSRRRAAPSSGRTTRLRPMRR